MKAVMLSQLLFATLLMLHIRTSLLGTNLKRIRRYPAGPPSWIGAPAGTRGGARSGISGPSANNNLPSCVQILLLLWQRTILCIDIVISSKFNH